MAVLSAFQNTRYIFNISLCGYEMVIIIFKYDSHMVMLRIVEYLIKKDNISSRRLKAVVVPAMILNAAVCLRPFFPSRTTCKRTGS